MDRRTFSRQLIAGLAALPVWNLAYGNNPEPGRKKVIVIGAGIAGAAAARTLSDAGLEVQVLEAGSRVGGRIHTFRDWGVNLELGANWVHNTNHPDNRIDEQLLELGVAMEHTNYYRFQLFDDEGQRINHLRALLFSLELQKKIQRAWPALSGAEAGLSIRQVFDHVASDSGLSSARQAMLRFNREAYANTLAASLSEASADHYLGADNGEALGKDQLVLGGYDTLVNHLLRGVPVQLHTEVQEIRQTGQGVAVLAGNDMYEADYAIVTVPLSILQNGGIQFSSALPEEKTRALSRLRLGLFNKVAMRFTEKFWSGSPDFLVLQNGGGEHNSILLNHHHYSGQPILVAMPVADAAARIEAQDEETVQASWREALHKAYPHREIEFRDIAVTRWQANPFSRGSYSFVPVGAAARDFAAIAEPLGRIHFSGEATIAAFHGTVHGAYLSGVREARTVIERR